jgi:Mor family transcriptional regulator
MMMTQVKAEELAPLNAVMGPDLPELLRETTEVLYLQLVDEEEAKPDNERCVRLAHIALAQVMRLSELIGGTQPYWPSVKYFYLSKRNQQMCEEFKGDYIAIARKHKITERQARTIIDVWQRQKFLAKQNSLFPGV